MYEARKNAHGGDRGNQYTKVASAQNGHMAKLRISEQIAAEVGVGKTTVKRAEQFAKGVDAIREVSVEAAGQITKKD